MSRIVLESEGGDLSIKTTFEQLNEYVQRAEECAMALARACADRDDETASASWKKVAGYLNKSREIISDIGTKKTKLSVGYGAY